MELSNQGTGCVAVCSYGTCPRASFVWLLRLSVGAALGCPRDQEAVVWKRCSVTAFTSCADPRRFPLVVWMCLLASSACEVFKGPFVVLFTGEE